MQIKVLIATLALAYNVADVAADDDGPSQQCMEDIFMPAMLAGDVTEDGCSLSTEGCEQAVTDNAASTVCTQDEKDMMNIWALADDCANLEGIFCDGSSYGSSYGSSDGSSSDGPSDECMENTINPFLCGKFVAAAASLRPSALTPPPPRPPQMRKMTSTRRKDAATS